MAHRRGDIKAKTLDRLDRKAKGATWEAGMIPKELVNETQKDRNLIFLQSIEPPYLWRLQSLSHMINATAENIQSRKERRACNESTSKRRRIISDDPNGNTPERPGKIKITSAPFAVTPVTDDKGLEETDLDME